MEGRPQPGEDQLLVRHIRETAFDLTTIQRECTPSYLNNEGEAKIRWYLGETYGLGFDAFDRLLQEWRAKGDLDGLVLGASGLRRGTHKSAPSPNGCSGASRRLRGNNLTFGSSTGRVSNASETNETAVRQRYQLARPARNRRRNPSTASRISGPLTLRFISMTSLYQPRSSRMNTRAAAADASRRRCWPWGT
jgi:hypothetical protein